jgi:uncharacterized protein YggE
MSDQAPNGTPDENPTPSPAVASSAPSVDRIMDRHLGPITLARAIAVTAAASLVLGILIGPILNGHPTIADATTAAPIAGAPEHTVTVSGSGQVSVAPDVADVVIGVMVQKPTVAEAQTAAATSMTAVVAAVKKDGVDEKDIVTTDVSLSPVYDYGSGGSVPRLVGQQFSNTVKITVRNIKSVASVVDDAITAGATTVAGISFRLNDPSAVQAGARQLAMADAKSKAVALTSAAGVSIKGVASITETTAQTNPTYYGALPMAASAGSVSTPIQTGTTDVVVQVSVSYLIG